MQMGKNVRLGGKGDCCNVFLDSLAVQACNTFTHLKLSGLLKWEFPYYMDMHCPMTLGFSHLFFCFFICLFICLFVYLFVCLFVVCSLAGYCCNSSKCIV